MQQQQVEAVVSLRFPLPLVMEQISNYLVVKHRPRKVVRNRIKRFNFQLPLL